MNLLALPAAALAWVGRKGTLVVAASVFVGLVLPALTTALKPYLGETIVLLLTLAFLRVDPVALRHHVARPGLATLAVVWVMLAVPTVLGVLFLGAGIQRNAPSLFLILMLQIMAPPVMSAPALAALMGLDVALTLVSMVISLAITPLTASLFSHLFVGSMLISPLDLGIKLFLIIAGSAAAAAVIRGIAGRAFIEAQRERIDGLSVLAMVTFAVAAMDGVADHIGADPLLVFKLLALAFALSLGLIALTALVFLRAGRARALAIGLLAGSRNIGLMLAAMGFAVPDLSWLYFALAQFPIYMLPHLLRPLARRLQRSARR